MNTETVFWTVEFSYPKERENGPPYMMNGYIGVLCDTAQNAIDAVMKHQPAAKIHSVQRRSRGMEVIAG